MRLKFRIIIVAAFLLFAVAGLCLRLFKIQIADHDKFNELARRNYLIEESKVSPVRGDIYDCNGERLAVNKHTYSIGFNSSYGNVSSEMLKEISNACNIDLKYCANLMKDCRRFTWIERHVSPVRAECLLKYRKNGLVIVEENSRFYPHAPIASHVIGCVGTDNQGLSGIEFNFDEQLKGSSGSRKMIRDARGQVLYLETAEERKKMQAADIYLTIDINLQYIVERELQKGFERYRPRWAMAVIQNPHNGEILAMATYPSYNNNNGAPEDVEDLKNLAVTNIFEPGSTFKIVTAAAALEENAVKPDESINCEDGEYVVGGFPIRDFEPHKFLNFSDCLVYSSNIGFAKIGERLGSRLLYKYARDFGFGNFTGVRLPGETRGILRKPDRWSGTSLSRISFGQEIGVTAVQLVGAFSAVANGGVLYEPRIIKKISVDGQDRYFEPLAIRRVISESKARLLTNIMTDVVKRGSGVRAAVEGYPVAGKTGTAQKFNPETLTYAENKYVALFGGFVPANEPEFTLLVVFDEPDKSLYWGGYVAAPVFSSIAEACLNYLNIPPAKAVN